jgi:GTP-binding protein
LIEVVLSVQHDTAYALSAIEPRGTLFIKPGAKVYAGMIIGEHSKEGDIEVNPVRAKVCLPQKFLLSN